MTDNTIFFLVNLIGGILVLTSYVWGIINFPFHRNLLWGDIGSNLKKIIISSMFTGAIGYLFTFVWFWKILIVIHFILVVILVTTKLFYFTRYFLVSPHFGCHLLSNQ